MTRDDVSPGAALANDRAWSKRGASNALLIALAVALALCSSCRCTTCAPSAQVDRTAGAHRVRVEGQAAHEWGIDGVGAPHVGGVIWPTVKGAGYTIRIVVDDRPALFVDAGSRMPSKDELNARVQAVEVASSPNDEHLGVRATATDDWRVVHLLPRGVPFESPHSAAGQAIPWNDLPSPTEIAMAEIRDPRCHAPQQCTLLWSAVAAQPAGPPLDGVLLEIWPAAEPARDIAVQRARPATAAAPAWRRAAGAKALQTLEQKEQRRVAFDLLVALEDPESLGAMDRRLVDLWKVEGESDHNASFELVEARLSTDPKRKLGPPMAPPERAHATATARELIRTPPRIRDAGELVILAGSAQDAIWMDDVLLELWPLNDEVCSFCDGTHEVLEKRARGWGPPVQPEWRERATDRAARVVAQPNMKPKAGRFLLAIDTDRAIGILLESWLETWPDEMTEHHFVMPVVTRGSLDWQRRATAKADACIERFQAQLKTVERPVSLADDDRWRATRCLQLATTLGAKTLPCARWRELVRLGDQSYGPYSSALPERCRDGG